MIYVNTYTGLKLTDVPKYLFEIGSKKTLYEREIIDGEIYYQLTQKRLSQNTNTYGLHCDFKTEVVKLYTSISPEQYECHVFTHDEDIFGIGNTVTVDYQNKIIGLLEDGMDIDVLSGYIVL